MVSRLDYCNALFTGLPFQSLGRLQLIQNAAARLFGGLQKYDHVTSTMKSDLHWLRIPERISFKLSTLVYKALHGEGPIILTIADRYYNVADLGFEDVLFKLLENPNLVLFLTMR